MGWFTGIVVFILGSNLKRKFVWTTIVTVVVWIIIFLIIDAEIISFQDMAQDMFEEDRAKS